MGLLDIIGQSAQIKNGAITQQGSGLLGWISENPSLFTGFSTALLASNQGMSGLESLGLGGAVAKDVRAGVQQTQKAAAERAALQSQAMLEQQKLLLDIEKAKQDTKLGNVDLALKQKQAEQEVINSAYDAAAKMFPKDPKSAADYAQKLILQRTKGGSVSVGNKWFGGILGSRPITYTPSQTGVAAIQ